MSFGSILIYPPQYWGEEFESLREWRPAEFDEFPDVPFTPEDVVIFGGVNFTPDRWFVVLRGPFEGRIFRFSHDDTTEMDKPWAQDFKSWAERVRAGMPAVFGGCIRFVSEASPDNAPQDAELYPERLIAAATA